MRILLIEDDQSVADYIIKGLKQSGFNVDHADEGKQGLFLATGENYDVMIIDRMLPNVDGLTIIQTHRGAENKTPILILSALSEVDDRVKGLKAGGDDYLVKPFAFVELLARIEAIHRRQESSATQTRLKVSDLEMDLLAHKVTRAGESFNLQPREYKLLEYLMKHAGQVVTRTMLLENVWEYHFDPQTNVIDVHISRLRQKIDKGFDHQLLTTVRGAGYMLHDPAAE
jgi:two-component system OmpR family response regulator